jgi:hypothetical protein
MTESCATVTNVQVFDGYCVELTFSDCVRGVVDLANRIVGRGGLFAPLEDPQFFRQVAVDNELGTIAWPNGADFCPDLLYRWATGEAVQLPESETIIS